MMPGNVLDISQGTVLHQVNCRGIMGGLALALSRKYPQAFTDYFLLCDKYGAKNFGSAVEGHASKSLSIIHVFGQLEAGANTDQTAVLCALESLTSRPLLRPIYAPYRMGCGIGGGDWRTYSNLLLRALPDLIVVQLPEDRQ